MSAPKSHLVLSRRARNDYRDIEAYTMEQWDERQWVSYEADLAQALDTIAEHPEVGRRRPELGPDTRSLVVREHVIYYRISDDRIQVLRIVHGRSDPRRALRTRG